MSKPDDIPQDVWDQSNIYVQQWANGPGTIRQTVARAIMAERAGLSVWNKAALLVGDPPPTAMKAKPATLESSRDPQNPNRRVLFPVPRAKPSTTP